MRGVLGLVSLLIVVAVIGLLAKRQLGMLGVEGASPKFSPSATLPGSSQQLQSQVKQSVEAAMQQARPEPEDK